MKPIYKFGVAGLIVLTLVLASWLLVIVPGLVGKTIQNETARRTGRTLIINGGASMQFSPQLGVALRDVTIQGASTNSEPVVTAKLLLVPASFLQLLTLHISQQEIQLQEPIFTLQIDAAGQSNVVSEKAAVDDPQIAVSPLRIRFENGIFKYLDEPNAKRFAVTDLEGLVDLDAQNAAKINAAMTIAGERTHIAANLKSFDRAFHDGSPFDFNLDAVGASVSYGGRIVATQGIDLAGQLRVDTNNAVRLFKWLGVDLHGLGSNVPFSLTAALESNHGGVNLKQSEVLLSGMKGKGEITVAGKATKQSVTLNLEFENLNTDLILDSKQNLSWSEKPFDMHNFNALDISYDLSATKMRIGVFETADAQIVGSLKDGLSATTIRSPSLGEAKLNFNAEEAPTKLGVELALALGDAKTFMQQFAGMNWYSGAMTLNGTLEAAGNSQAEMIGALDGQVEIKSSEAAFKGVSLSALAGKAVIQPLEGWDGGETEGVVLNGKFILADGIATVQENNLVAPGVKVTTTGDIDLLRQALNLNAQVKGAGKAAQIVLEGPWAKPRIGAKDLQ
jgi:uncharacterized protein involved in outer membrane biogenesis